MRLEESKTSASAVFPLFLRENAGKISSCSGASMISMRCGRTDCCDRGASRAGWRRAERSSDGGGGARRTLLITSRSSCRARQRWCVLLRQTGLPLQAASMPLNCERSFLRWPTRFTFMSLRSAVGVRAPSVPANYKKQTKNDDEGRNEARNNLPSTVRQGRVSNSIWWKAKFGM